MKKVLVALSSNSIAARECLIGVFQFANSGHAWNIQLLEKAVSITPQVVEQAVRDGTDGIITGIAEATPGYMALMDSTIPLALNNYPDNHPPPAGRGAIILHNDELMIGRTGAQFLRSKGSFRSYAFVPTHTQTYWSTFRHRGFRLELSKWRISPLSYMWNRGGLGQWLTSLPKPAAVMAASDNVAVNVIETCRHMGISVPGQVMVLGVDNDELYCNSSRPMLSSIYPNHVEMGRRAAYELDRVMQGRKRGQVSIYIPPIGVIERESTRTVPPAAHLIQSALDYMRQHWQERIRVRDVAAQLHVSESLLRLRFRQMHGKSVLDTLLELRLDAASKLLSQTKLPVSAVAKRCGFGSACRMSHLFRERLGHPPSSLRKPRPASAT